MRSKFIFIISAAAVAATPNLVSAQDVLVQRYNVFVQRDQQSFIEKTVKELNTPEGSAVLTVVGTYLGMDPKILNAAVAGTASLVVPSNQQDTSGIIRSPEGYTVCLARPADPKMGAGQHGIETHGDTTFNTTLLRVIPGKVSDDGLSWSMSVPKKRGTDTRVAGSFDIVFVKADPGWRERYPACRPAGEHPWLARNNRTQLNARCTVQHACGS
ncbi:hypothetical protein [Bradyrhizobium sp. CCBAU 11357]|uniref:hypothetical protein n=1 Tax=Bradyrhizobium sp. CCBAU 11357 TaxID=1630808 RepID=UPI002304AEC3|nr:hypothetical protein [Bradyrhizobium sp. CCBAU 11357]